MKTDLGAVPGTKVKVEARLNFYNDARWPHVEPWEDKITVDGGDVWEFILEMDDSQFHVWSVKDFSTIRTLGRDHQSRYFPWSNNSELSSGFEIPLFELMGSKASSASLASPKSRVRWLFTGVS